MSEKLAEMTPSFLMRAASAAADSQGKAVGASPLLQALRQACSSKGFREAREWVILWGPFQTSSPILQPTSRGSHLRCKICILSPVRHSYTAPFKSYSHLFIASDHCSSSAKYRWLCQGYSDLYLSPSVYQASLNTAASKQRLTMPAAVAKSSWNKACDELELHLENQSR